MQEVEVALSDLGVSYEAGQQGLVNLPPTVITTHRVHDLLRNDMSKSALSLSKETARELFSTELGSRNGVYGFSEELGRVHNLIRKLEATVAKFQAADIWQVIVDRVFEQAPFPLGYQTDCDLDSILKAAKDGGAVLPAEALRQYVGARTEQALQPQKRCDIGVDRLVNLYEIAELEAPAWLTAGTCIGEANCNNVNARSLLSGEAIHPLDSEEPLDCLAVLRERQPNRVLALLEHAHAHAVQLAENIEDTSLFLRFYSHPVVVELLPDRVKDRKVIDRILKDSLADGSPSASDDLWEAAYAFDDKTLDASTVATIAAKVLRGSKYSSISDISSFIAKHGSVLSDQQLINIAIDVASRGQFERAEQILALSAKDLSFDSTTLDRIAVKLDYRHIRALNSYRKNGLDPSKLRQTSLRQHATGMCCVVNVLEFRGRLFTRMDSYDLLRRGPGSDANTLPDKATNGFKALHGAFLTLGYQGQPDHGDRTTRVTGAREIGAATIHFLDDDEVEIKAQIGFAALDTKYGIDAVLLPLLKNKYGKDKVVDASAGAQPMLIG